MANPFTSKLPNCVTVGLIALTLFSASNAYAQLTIITGSYSQVDLAKKRLDDPAFKALGAYLLHSRSQQYAARVAVGCFASPELAKQALIDVRAAGAKGVWLLDVGSRCKAKGAQAGRAASAAGSSHPIHQSRNITKRILIKNAKPDVAVQSKNGDGAEADSGAVLIKPGGRRERNDVAFSSCNENDPLTGSVQRKPSRTAAELSIRPGGCTRKAWPLHLRPASIQLYSSKRNRPATSSRITASPRLSVSSRLHQSRIMSFRLTGILVIPRTSILCLLFP